MKAGRGGIQPDLDDSVGHGLDVRLEAGEQIGAGAHALLEKPRDRIGLRRLAIGPFGAAQAEDIALPAVRDDPALGQPAHHFALRVERQQPLRRRRQHRLASRAAVIFEGVGQLGGAADQIDHDRPSGIRPTGRQAEHEAGQPQARRAFPACRSPCHAHAQTFLLGIDEPALALARPAARANRIWCGRRDLNPHSR